MTRELKSEYSTVLNNQRSKISLTVTIEVAPGFLFYELFFATEWKHLWRVVRVANINKKNSPKWAKRCSDVPGAPP